MLGQLGNALAQRGGQAGVFFGEREGFEAAGFDVDRAIFQCASIRQCPQALRLAGEHAQVKRIAQGDGNQLVVGQDTGLQKLEEAVFGGFDGGNIARQACELLAHFSSGFAV